MKEPLVQVTDHGLFVPAADLYIDPWKPVDRAVITHAHADHARGGSGRYLSAQAGHDVLRVRLGSTARIDTLPWGERIRMGSAHLSLHPAGHILGAAQIRVEVGGEVWVVSGDYKLESDPTCRAFEPVPCHTFISECTFGLPIYRWPTPRAVFGDILTWWAGNAERGRTSILFGYSLGKAQRLLAGIHLELLDQGMEAPGPILVHGAVHRLLPPFHRAGVPLPDVLRANRESARASEGRALVVAPPSAGGTPWIRKFGQVSTGFASGWMRIRGHRRRRGGDRGFVLSDHVDWPGLLTAIRATGAERIGLTHGTTGPAVRFLREEGWDAWNVPTRFEGEAGSEAPDGSDSGEHETEGQEDA
ncbi:MAG: ligase-associated DNA damage response exonuclease [Gemmatimonadales bacterium]|nr:MAG: ligase-associated DNA damage response exonuclease [Gemmatimonadales bacterium]